MIIGPSGSGKSTIGNGLYYFKQTGEIRLESNG